MVCLRSGVCVLEICRGWAVACIALTLFLPGTNGISQTPAVQVPNVVGSTLAEAEHTLAVRGLRVGTITRQSSNETREVVLDQEPRAGKMVPVGGSVNLVVSEVHPPVVLMPAPQSRVHHNSRMSTCRQRSFTPHRATSVPRHSSGQNEKNRNRHQHRKYPARGLFPELITCSQKCLWETSCITCPGAWHLRKAMR